MPIFEYRCKRCKDKFEVLFGLSQDPLEILCPRCKSKDIEKCFSIFGVRGGSTLKSTSSSSCSSCKATSCATCH